MLKSGTVSWSKKDLDIVQKSIVSGITLTDIQKQLGKEYSLGDIAQKKLELLRNVNTSTKVHIVPQPKIIMTTTSTEHQYTYKELYQKCVGEEPSSKTLEERSLYNRMCTYVREEMKLQWVWKQVTPTSREKLFTISDKGLEQLRKYVDDLQIQSNSYSVLSFRQKYFADEKTNVLPQLFKVFCKYGYLKEGDGNRKKVLLSPQDVNNIATDMRKQLQWGITRTQIKAKYNEEKKLWGQSQYYLTTLKCLRRALLNYEMIDNKNIPLYNASNGCIRTALNSFNIEKVSTAPDTSFNVVTDRIVEYIHQYILHSNNKMHEKYIRKDIKWDEIKKVSLPQCEQKECVTTEPSKSLPLRNVIVTVVATILFIISAILLKVKFGG